MTIIVPEKTRNSVSTGKSGNTRACYTRLYQKLLEDNNLYRKEQETPTEQELASQAYTTNSLTIITSITSARNLEQELVSQDIYIVQ